MVIRKVLLSRNKTLSLYTYALLLKIYTFQYMALSIFYYRIPQCDIEFSKEFAFFIFPLGSANSVLLRFYCLLSLLPNICSFKFNKFLNTIVVRTMDRTQVFSEKQGYWISQPFLYCILAIDFV